MIFEKNYSNENSKSKRRAKGRQCYEILLRPFNYFALKLNCHSTVLEILIFSLLNFGCYNRHRSYGTHLMIQKYEFRIPKVLDNYNIFLFSILHQLNVLYQSCQKDVRPSKMDALLYLLAQEGHNLHRMGKRILNHSRRSRI